VYIDPNVPDVHSTRPSSAPGVVGSSLDDIVDAAGAGEVRVDRATGAATIQALAAVQEQVDTLRRLASAEADTRLGGGYAQRIDRFNREWTVAGAGSAAEVMERFSEQLGRLKEAVRVSMAAYQASDANGERQVERAGEAL
jgi:hypothetical protein